MPWCVGIDEAGYGPNLGPLVVAASACRVPQADPGCLWMALGQAVRRMGGRNDGRVVIDDSKKIHQGPDGLARLERSVLAWASLHLSAEVLHDLLEAAADAQTQADLADEPWFDRGFPLPSAAEPAEVADAANRLRAAAASGPVVPGPIRLVVIPTPRFNRLLDDWQVKSGVLGTGVQTLLRWTVGLPGDDPIEVTVDRLGGRLFYAPLLQAAFPDCWPRAVRETPAVCEYRLDGLRRPTTIRFLPKADGEHLNVALASMTAKYVREICMIQFNRFWADRVPGIAPTAGYPVDAGRFFAAIRPALAAAGLDERDVWRLR